MQQRKSYTDMQWKRLVTRLKSELSYYKEKTEELEKANEGRQLEIEQEGYKEQFEQSLEQITELKQQISQYEEEIQQLKEQVEAKNKRIEPVEVKAVSNKKKQQVDSEQSWFFHNIRQRAK